MTSREMRLDDRFAEKEASRQADVRALQSGAKTMAQLKHESESFAFDRSRAAINLSTARKLS